MWKIDLPWTPQTENPWGKMDWGACYWMAKSRWKTNQYALKVLHRAQKMGIHFPNLCHLHQNQKASIGHGTIPRQAQNLRKKHFSWQIRFFWIDERQRLHGWELTRSFQKLILELWVNDFRIENQDHLLEMYPRKMFPKNQTKNESRRKWNSPLIFGKNSHQARKLVQYPRS